MSVAVHVPSWQLPIAMKLAPSKGNRCRSRYGRSKARWGKKRRPYTMVLGKQVSAPRVREANRYDWP